jgi:8-oxo-dGTP pyrophosphatase MutT (NUDIX family)
MEHLEIISDREAFRELTIKRLSESPHNFLDQHKFIKSEERRGTNYDTSGVLLLLRFDDKIGGYEFVLTKRSKDVVQPGDLSCPGGHVSRRDRISGFLIANNLSLFMRGGALKAGRDAVGSDGFKIAANYLATALREAREETGLRKSAVEYLGALPSYGLVSFRRVIYPSVGLVTGRWVKRLNWEVEKIVTISIKDILDPEKYHRLIFAVPQDIIDVSARKDWNFPSFVVDDGNGREILWGATFNIIMSFLKIVTDFDLPDIPAEKVITKEVPENYFTGRFKKGLKEGLIRERQKA